MIAVKSLEILLLCDYRVDIASTVREHIDALTQSSQHRIRKVSIFGDLPPRLDLNHFDAIIIHYSLIACHDNYVSPSARKALGKYRGLKAIFIQDEYRFVDATIAAMREIGVDVLFTCVPEQEIEKVYPSARLPGVIKKNVLTGYVPVRLLGMNVTPYSARPIDVGYRARKVPGWLGSLGWEKYEIGKRFRDAAAHDSLSLNISFREEDRFYGDEWINFVCQCKAMLGVESGASVFDFDGSIQRNVERHVLREPDADFHRLKELYFADTDGKISLNQISPRCFEAAALRTLLIMYEGDYSGRMAPWRHYVPLKKDHSNHAEVVALIKDEARAQAIVERAFQEVACDPRNTFEAFVSEFDVVMASTFREEKRATLPAPNDADFAMLSAPSFATRLRQFIRKIFESSYRFVFSVLLGRAQPETREKVQGWLKYVLHPARLVFRRLIS